ncbi:MAG: response regulator [Gammaproteobacteria bacterium]|nr:response regulator [Gammaproteobacteria bacterium]MCK5262127.1 response regulator [Gammaproteobacteria bacterium]
MTADKKQTALIIEDNEDNMVLIAMLLQDAGYETICADTGLKGVQLALGQEPDFVLLDIQLPDINGAEVLKRIRALDADVAGIPIIAMTSYAMSGDREKLLAAGCDGYIEKPIDTMHVIDQIRAIVGDT